MFLRVFEKELISVYYPIPYLIVYIVNLHIGALVHCNSCICYVMLLCMHEVGSLVLANLAGILACLDGYMNIAMEQTEEYVNGQLKNKYGDAFIRGNNGTDV